MTVAELQAQLAQAKAQRESYERQFLQNPAQVVNPAGWNVHDGYQDMAPILPINTEVTWDEKNQRYLFDTPETRTAQLRWPVFAEILGPELTMRVDLCTIRRKPGSFTPVLDQVLPLATSHPFIEFAARQGDVPVLRALTRAWCAIIETLDPDKSLGASAHTHLQHLAQLYLAAESAPRVAER